jgi:hypothetical protein
VDERSGSGQAATVSIKGENVMIPQEWRDYTWTVRPLVVLAWFAVSPAVVLPLMWIASRDGIDWPAWVQAVGSVAAILVAIWISERSHKRDRERARQQEIDDTSRVVGLAERAVFEARLSVGGVKGSATKLASVSAEKVPLGRLRQAAEILRGVLLQPLPSDVAADVFAVLAHVAEVEAEVVKWAPLQLPGDWEDFVNGHSFAINSLHSNIERWNRWFKSQQGIN